MKELRSESMVKELGKLNGRPVAVKTVHREIARDKPLEDFIGECQLLASLEGHPNIIQSYGAFEDRTGEPMLHGFRTNEGESP